MQQLIIQIFDQKSPLFIVQVAMLIMTVFVINEPHFSTTNQFCSVKSIRYFQIAAIVLTSCQIIFKLIVVQILQCFKVKGQKVQNILLFIIYSSIICHLALWIFCICLVLNQNFREYCYNDMPHYYYMICYAGLYLLINLAVVILVLDQILWSRKISLFKSSQRQEIKNYQ